MDDSKIDRDHARTIALVQCATTIAALALFAAVDDAWYLRLLPPLVLLLITHVAIREWSRRRVPQSASGDARLGRPADFAFASLVVAVVGLNIIFFLPGPRWVSGPLGMTWIFLAPWRPLVRVSSRFARSAS